MDTTAVDLLSLISTDTKLTKQAATNGGEYAGPCPFCGGEDRFRVWPRPARGSPRFWCRQCLASGDAIAYIMRRNNVSFQVACELLDLELASMPRIVKSPKKQPQKGHVSQAQEWRALSDPAWQRGVSKFVDYACYQLDQSLEARAYLYRRGLQSGTFNAFCLGYNPMPYRARWGSTPIWLPPGIVIPCEHADGTIWSLNVRRLDGESPKYIKPRGCANALYVAGVITPKTTVVLVEGEFDAISIWQATRGQVAAAATGSTSGAFLHTWIALLAQARRLVLAFDNDQAGQKAVERWKQAFPTAQHLPPIRHDVNDMLIAGDSIPAWLGVL